MSLQEDDLAMESATEKAHLLLDEADVDWTPEKARSMDTLNVICESLLDRGYCVLQMLPYQELAEEAHANVEKMQDVGWLRAEMYEAYLGLDNMTLTKELPPEISESEAVPEVKDAPKLHEETDTKSESDSSGCDPELYGSDSEPEETAKRKAKKEADKKASRKKDLPPDFTALRHFDGQLLDVAELLAYGPEALGVREVLEKSITLLRIPHMAEGESLVGNPGHIDEMDVGLGELFLTWCARRKLCMFYNVEGQGIIDLMVKQAEAAQSSTRFLLRPGRLILFRADLMQYRYVPEEDDSLILQTWLLDTMAPLQFRTLPTPPGTQGCDRVHVKSMTERFPAGCDNCDMTCALFTAGTDSLLEPPITRFDKDLYYVPDRDAALLGKAYIIHGSFVEEDQLIGFDNDFFGIDIEEAQAIGPAQRWIMEVGYECLWRGGWTKKQLRGTRIGSFLGDSGSEWHLIYQRQDRFSITCNSGYITCSRLSHSLGLTGPNVTVDTACSASLVATNAAAHLMMRRHVKPGEKIAPLSDDNMKDQAQLKYALCMGVLVMLHPAGWIGECAATMLSYKGRAFTFDAGADGFIRGEGCCAVHIAAENDGERQQGDRTLAVLMGSCSNQDGRSASLTAPHGPSQQMCIRSSLREARLEPGEVQIGECHGTGTALGDPIEIGAMKSVQIGKRSNPLYHASAKSNVGHEEANAGTCGLIKVVLLLNGGLSTPNPHLTSLNPHLDITAYPVMFTNELATTSRGDQCMGVSSFGFGGSNARADLWGDVEKGQFKEGQRMDLGPADSASWIKRFLDGESAGVQHQVLENFYVKHKSGH
eukprot:TRINITY_DN16844_c0_g1_i1.p1 TRINITY_DN16844_c0_g1~~TRINITY_DN16844_c0_g1_i1.p1  ORF type:complete len:821 (+),score=197.48 TRINITY_DN16844_c0_g1_i1:110-2572(+)